MQEQVKPGQQQGWFLIFLCWLIAMAAVFGSLFLSEVMALKPCVLCWWQRIFMYPLALLFLVGLYPKNLDSGQKVEPSVVRYTLPLALIGLGFAIYHLLIYKGVIPEALQPCSEDLSCAEQNLQLLGFISIPLLSIFAYGGIITLLLIYQKRSIQ
jgi:disulfide bond formation protein DsbB